YDDLVALAGRQARTLVLAGLAPEDQRHPRAGVILYSHPCTSGLASREIRAATVSSGVARPAINSATLSTMGISTSCIRASSASAWQVFAPSATFSVCAAAY